MCNVLTSVGTAILAVGPNVYVMLFGQVLFGYLTFSNDDFRLGGANTYMSIISTLGGWFDGDKRKASKVTVAMCLSTFWYRITSFGIFI